MYPIYHTDSLILGSKNIGEASRIFFVYTKDFGLIRVYGQGIRKLTSKLRFHLEDYSLVKLELIKGREFWRPKKVEKICSFSQNLKTVINISNLVLRLCDLEEKNEPFFEDLSNGFKLLKEFSNSLFSRDPLTKLGVTPSGPSALRLDSEPSALEAVLVLRLLSHLGYIGDPNLLSFIQPPLTEEIFTRAESNLAKIIPAINQSLRDSHL